MGDSIQIGNCYFPSKISLIFKRLLKYVKLNNIHEM